MRYWPSVKSRWLDAGKVLFLGRSGGQWKCKKEGGQYPIILTEQAWSIKDIYGTNVGNLKRATWALLARSGSRSERRIRYILATCGFSQIIIVVVSIMPKTKKTTKQHKTKIKKNTCCYVQPVGLRSSAFRRKGCHSYLITTSCLETS